MTNAPFWNNPPWANGRGGYQMGLSPLELNRWCKRAITAKQREAKLTLLQNQRATVLQATHWSTPAQELLADHIGAIHPQINARHLLDQLEFPVDNQALILAALCVPEDLCLLQRHNSQYQLVAGCVTAPSYWRLHDKIGLGLAAVHSNVPGLNDALGQRMNTFFERLPSDRCLLRRNWFLHDSNARFQPEPEPERSTPITTAAGAAKLTVRCETQTLRRLSDDVIAFTIDVDCYPLQEIADFPQAAQTLHRALCSRNIAERLAADQDDFEEGVLAFLEQSF